LTIGDKFEQCLHPVGELLQSIYAHEWLGLCGESGFRFSVSPTSFPPLASFAGLKEA
jgi:hypothetical protein